MIDLDNITESAVEVVFAAVPTAVGLGSYYRMVQGEGSASYDPDTDTAISPVAPITNVRMMKLAANEEDLIGTNVTINDAKFLMPGKDLPFAPSAEDWFTHQGIAYNVIKIRPLPTPALRIVYGRQK